MKNIVASVLFGLILSSVKANPNTSSVCENVREAFVNDYFDCAGYFWCSSVGQPIHIRCPDGFWFDSSRNVCVLSGSIPCTLCQSIGGASSLTVTKSAEHECPADGIHFMPHKDCENFRVCVHGTGNGKFICATSPPFIINIFITVLACPKGLHWSPVNGLCDFPAEAKCVNN